MGLLEVIIFAAIASILVAESVSGYAINFPTFDFNTDSAKFLVDNATISTNGAFQVTSDTVNGQFSMKNLCGRAMLKRKLSVYRGQNLSSFSTSFILNIVQEDGGGGEGLAFIITSIEYNNTPSNCSGQWLGLFNASTNGSDSSKVVAVEFDTRRSPGTTDPDGNHVGINVNNINSKTCMSLNQSNINLKGGYDIQAWILYDGNTKKLDVYVAKTPDDRPLQPLVSSTIDLSNGILDGYAYFGFSASTGNGTELNCIKSWNLTVIEFPDPGAWTPLFIVLILASLIFVVVVATGSMVFVKYRHSKAETSTILCALQSLPGRPREFKYEELKKATNKFSAAAELGSGGFGTVYKGILPKENTVVAVKRIAKYSKHAKDEFISEISVINRLRHRNLVPLLGWCHEKGELIMVYEYMPNGSLNGHIYMDSAGRFLDWEQRYKIVSGVASALLYLHGECEQQVIHRDVKASNIMLDSEYNARLGDFGIARLIVHGRRSFTATGVAGTPGYIAPECFNTGRVTAESDVFSFGAVVLEVVCGRRPRSRGGEDEQDLVGWVWKLYGENRLLEAVDSRLAIAGNVNVNEEDIKRLLMLGLACSDPNPGDRPTMKEVTQMLARTMAWPHVPISRPDFKYFTRFPSDIIFTSTSLSSTHNPNGNRNVRRFTAYGNHNLRRTMSEYFNRRSMLDIVDNKQFQSSVSR
jgi:serine/threonine protein kinase